MNDKPDGVAGFTVGNLAKKENQFIDFRLITTREEKPRFFLSCQHNKKAAKAAFFVAEETARA
ncbi:hypothetical protein [Serratia marcescens]|uniref:hypothetical protein n=1 Tax=Serratia marcescens TaxID=615 RepID=UPI001EFF054A|nr:hypothetical protein [Serratia marcescens]